MFESPPYSTYPSGHATESHLVALLLQQLLFDGRGCASQTTAFNDWMKQLEVMLRRLAMRIADNRAVAGIHFPFDSEAGECLAKYLRQVIAADRLKPSSANCNVFHWIWQMAVDEWKPPT